MDPRIGNDKDYKILLQTLLRLIDAIPPPPPDSPDAGFEQLTRKIFAHAVSIYQLRHGSSFTPVDGADPVGLLDFSSVNVLARAIIETYLTMHEVFLAPQNQDARAYRYLVYRIRGARLQQALSTPDMPRLSTQVLCEQIQATQSFQNLDASTQSAVLKGDQLPALPFAVRAASAGLPQHVIHVADRYYADHLAGGAISGGELSAANTIEAHIQHIRSAMMVTALILCYSIRAYVHRFTAAHQALNDYREGRRLVARLLVASEQV